MKNKLLLIYLSLSIFISGVGCAQTIPKANEGSLDLSQWNFNTDGVAKLNGNWEFYWQHFYLSKDFEGENSITKDGYNTIPSYWNGYKIRDKAISGDGFATYRLKIKISKKKQHLAVNLLNLSTAYNLYINGKLIASAGKIGKSKNEMIPSYHPQITSFEIDTSQMEVILQISNFHHRLGGPWQEMKLGKESAILLYSQRSLAIELFLIGSFIIMAFYHFGLFSLRKKDLSSLYFSLFCLALSVRVAFTGEYAINLILNLAWETTVFFEYLSFYSAFLVFSLFVQSLFPNEFSKKILKIILIACAFFSAIVMLTPVKIYSFTIIYFEIIVLLSGIYCLYAVFKAIQHKREGARSFMVGFFFLLITVFNDILYQNDLIRTSNLVAEGLFVFIFSQAFLLSSRFSKAFLRTEELTYELNFSNKNLENTILERTSEITNQKEELQAQANHLEQANIEINLQKDIIEEELKLRIENQAEIEKSKENLEELNATKDQFFSIIAHDLRNPFHAILGFSDILRKSVDLNNYALIRKFAENIFNLTSQTYKLLENLLEWSRIQQGKIIPNFQKHNLKSIVLDECFMIVDMAENKKIRLINDIKLNAFIYCDIEMTRTIIRNLLTNAIKFTNQEGVVSIQCVEFQLYTEISISDSGIGIKPEKVPSLFKVARNKSTSGTANEQGSGLGLLLCKEFCEKQNGEIRVESEVGKGSVFYFTIQRYIN